MARKAKRVRWICGECGKGALGPQRPRKNNVVRYCFPCSTKAGVLVERSSPTMLKASAKKADARKAKAARKRAREKKKRDALWVYGGWDLAKEAKRMIAHPEVGLRRVPKIEIRRRSDGFTSGCSYGGRVVLSIPKRASAGEALALLAHEIAHEACPRRERHGDRWKAVFTALAVDLYGADPMASDHYEQFHVYVEEAIDEALKEVQGE